MFRNYFIAALRNLARNKLYAVINIVGLAAGFAAAILIALFVRDEFSYDKWISGHSDIYHIAMTSVAPGQSAILEDRTTPNLAALLKGEFSSIQAIARIALPTGVEPIFRHGDIEAKENLYWADPNIFDVLRLPAIAGDLRTALDRPDGIVLTRALARKYFGRDDPIGQIIELDRQFPMRVTAVLEDLPSETHLNFTAIASGLAPFSPLAAFNSSLAGRERFYEVAYTYFRLAPGTDVGVLRPAMPAFAARAEIANPPLVRTYSIEPIEAMHLRAAAGDAMKPSGSRDTIYAISAVGVLILLVGIINFINLMTARATRRALEVGIRKVSGAQRRDLILQFIGEATIYALISLVVAQALVELILPSFNAFLDRSVALQYEPDAIAGMLALVLAVGLVAGSYPALVLSAFRPMAVLSSGRQQSLKSGRGQRVLVTVQFAVLLGLMISSAVIWRQTLYAMTAALRLDSDAVLIVGAGGCTQPFRADVLRLPGVRAAACSLGAPLERFAGVVAARPGGQKAVLGLEPVDFGFFELYGLRPVAGRFFSRDFGADALPLNEDMSFVPRVVLNETAVRGLGFPSAAAIGQTVSWSRTPRTEQQAQIIGVVPDFPLGSIRDLIPSAAFTVEPALLDKQIGQTQLSVKLGGHDVPETLAAIDRVWRAAGGPRPIARFFFDQRVRETYADVTRQAQIFGIFSGIALLIACLGLFGLAAFNAERRTKEIGIRKAMGAKSSDILRLLGWEFAKPVLWANLIAWPVAYYFMNRWLAGFAYHIDLAPWMFLAAGALALFIALATVSVHSLFVARAKPIEALRYE